MKPGERIYNKATDKQWSSQVYHKAKEVIEEKLSRASGAVQRETLILYMKQQYPSLCPDNIKRPTDPQLPYWKELVDSAIQALKKEGKVAKADNGWAWKGEKQPPPRLPDEPDKLAEQIKSLLEKLIELAKKEEKESPRLTHEEMVQKVKQMGEMFGKVTEPVAGAPYKHDCVWRDNRYATPKLVWEVCDKGNLDKDIASLIWAVKNWNAKCILVVFDESDFHAAQKKLGEENQVYPIKAEDGLKLHSLLQAGNTQAISCIFAV